MILLETVIMRVESADFTGAARFEFSLYGNPPSWVTGTTPAISAINQCNSNTALMIACSSWGLFQILGATLYGDLSYPDPIASYWIDSEQQITQFRKLVTKWGFDPQNFDFTDNGLIARFAQRYNGPGNVPAYSAAMKSAYADLSKEAA